MGVSSGLDKIILIYLRSWSYAVACLHSLSVGRVSVVVLFICTAFTIKVSASLLFFSCCIYVCPCCICTCTYSDFFFASFSAFMRTVMTCFPGTTLDRLIAASWIRIDRFFNIYGLIPRALHTSCFLIGMQHPSEKNHLSISWKHCWKYPLVVLRPQLTDLACPESMPDGQILFML